jgi:manganese efflux pump family protein
VLAVLLVAFSVGLDNLGAAAAIGVSGADRRLRLRFAIVFGTFEAAMPIVGLLLGNAVAHHLGNKGALRAGSVLCLTGLFALVSAVRSSDTERRTNYPTGRPLLLGAALSIDNLAIGFALGTYGVNVLVAACHRVGQCHLVARRFGTRHSSRRAARRAQRIARWSST